MGKHKKALIIPYINPLIVSTLSVTEIDELMQIKNTIIPITFSQNYLHISKKSRTFAI